MSHNPVRAKNFYKNNKKQRILNPHAGTKHSDIMKRQGSGFTTAMSGRTSTPYGFSACVFEGKNFVVRSEYLGAGNSWGFGVNEKGDRLYRVNTGILFVTVETDGVSQLLTIQPGGTFQAARGTKHCIATSTSDVELIVVESVNYAKNWTIVGAEPAVSGSTVSMVAASSDAAPPRRRDSRKAKAYAASLSRDKGRKVSPNRPGFSNPLPQSAIKATKATPLMATNAKGVNLKPAGARAFAED